MEAMAALFATAGGAAAGSAAAGAGAVGAAAAGTGAGFFTATSLGSIGAAAAPAVAGSAVAGATAGTLIGSLTAADILVGAFDTLSVVGGVLGTQSQIAQAHQAADDRELQIMQIQSQADLDELAALERIRARIAESTVNAYAGGIRPTGSVQAGLEDAIEQSDFETRVGGRDSRIREAQLQMEADAGRGSVTSILFSGLSRAARAPIDTYTRSRRRG